MLTSTGFVFYRHLLAHLAHFVRISDGARFRIGELCCRYGAELTLEPYYFSVQLAVPWCRRECLTKHSTDMIMLFNMFAIRQYKTSEAGNSLNSDACIFSFFFNGKRQAWWPLVGG